MGISGRAYPIGAGEYEATVVEVGAGLQSYRCAGVDLTCAYGDDTLPPKACGAMLVPWPNRIRGGRYLFEGLENQLALTEPGAGNAIHGFGRWTRWELVEHAADSVTLRLDVVPQTGYVHEVRVETTHRLDPDAGLSVTITATNTGTTRAPFGAGSHPYLSTRGHRIDDVCLTVPAAETIDVDGGGIPVGTRPVEGTDRDLRAVQPLGARRFDDGFTALERGPDGRGTVELATPSGGARLWFDRSFEYVQVFTVDELLPGVSGVATEPMSCAADSFNSGAGLVVLDPGSTWSGNWGIVAT